LSAEDAAHIKEVMVTFVDLGEEKHPKRDVPFTEANLTGKILNTKCT
jgi:hypothetical protein